MVLNVVVTIYMASFSIYSLITPFPSLIRRTHVFAWEAHRTFPFTISPHFHDSYLFPEAIRPCPTGIRPGRPNYANRCEEDYPKVDGDVGLGRNWDVRPRYAYRLLFILT